MGGQKPKRLTELQYRFSFKLYSQSNLKFIFDVCNFDFNAGKKICLCHEAVILSFKLNLRIANKFFGIRDFPYLMLGVRKI